MQTDIWATNSKGIKRRFTSIAWNLLGPNKDGWVAMDDFKIDNSSNQPLIKPPTGQAAKTQVIDNSKKKEAAPVADQKIDNSTEGAQASTGQTIAEVNEAKQAEFLKAAEGLKRGDIKDFFDKQTPKIAYKNSDSTTDFISKLGKALNYNIVELQKLLS